jgi:hypothetical protein
MATSVTLAATQITVTATEVGGSTIDQLCTAINDTAYMERTGSDPYTYTIKQGSGVGYARILQINTGCRINMTNNGDTLVWVNGGTYASNFYQLYIVGNGSMFYVNGNDITIDMGATATVPSPSCLCYGNLTLLGTAGHEVIVKNWGSYFPLASSQQYSTDNQVRMEYVKLQDTRIASAIIYVGYATAGRINAILKNLTIEQVAGTVGYGNGISLGNKSGFECIMENITYSKINNPLIFNTGEAIKIKDSLFSLSNAYTGLNYGEPYGIGTNQYNPLNVNNICNQIQTTYDNCIFESNYNSSGTKYAFYYVYYNAVVKFKNCTFRKEASSSIYRGIGTIAYGGTVVFIGTNTFTDYTNYKWGVDRSGLPNGRTLFGKEVTILVKDSNGDPIPNAFVRITQSDGNETYNWVTNSSGYVKDVFGDDCYLIEYEDTSTYGTGTLTQWSDSIASGRYHTITVSAPGKVSYSLDFELAATTSFTVTLQDVGETLPTKPEFKFITHKKIKGA